MIYFNKILPHILYPISIILLLFGWSIFSKKRGLGCAAFLLLLITSSPIISNSMLWTLELGQTPKQISEVEQADAIVVLGGMLVPITSKKGVIYEWNDPDRFFGGMNLIKANKASHIIFTAGKLPWQKDAIPEGWILAREAALMGVTRANILVTTTVENTQDEAISVKAILAKQNWHRIILVTSAFHMSRAKRLFENEGIEIQTYPVDFQLEARQLTFMDFLPSANAMDHFEFALREWIGRIYYRLMSL